ncbi:MAG: helix-turn-helix transcriptional regulator [Ruminococcus sp.]|nr:helix-turn-helix transcriptional regulator [Ruminococcus sp.]
MIKDLPQKLRELRLKNRLSQKQVAERLGISPSIISGYETGERTPSTEVIVCFSYLFNVTTDYLLGRQTDRSHYILDTKGLTDEQLQAIQALINTIKKQ